MKWRYLILAAAMTAAGIMETSAAEMPQVSVLSGQLVSVAAEGTAVKEGETLASVASLAGPVPAVRADRDGVVAAVYKHPGDPVRQGDEVVALTVR